MEIRRVPVESLVADPKNSNFHWSGNLNAIAESLEYFGQVEPLVVLKGTGRVIGGNGRLEVMRDLGWSEVAVVEFDGSEAQATALGVALNQTAKSSFFDDDALAAVLESLADDDFPLTATGFTSEEIDEILEASELVTKDESASDDEDVPPDDLFRAWETDNEWGVPTLDLRMQAEGLAEPIVKWGTRRRPGAGPGTIHFYADDYKFWGLHKNPRKVVDTHCTVAVEPNYSTWPEMARAEALWWLYSKRVIARWWQANGVRVVVDLNVDPAFEDLALLGVPEGWTAYATRFQKGHSKADLHRAYGLAASRSGGHPPHLHVFGGGKRVEGWCEEEGWAYIPEEADTSRGRNL